MEGAAVSSLLVAFVLRDLLVALAVGLRLSNLYLLTVVDVGRRV
jgi:hypothetical protein